MRFLRANPCSHLNLEHWNASCAHPRQTYSTHIRSEIRSTKPFARTTPWSSLFKPSKLQVQRLLEMTNKHRRSHTEGARQFVLEACNKISLPGHSFPTHHLRRCFTNTTTLSFNGLTFGTSGSGQQAQFNFRVYLFDTTFLHIQSFPALKPLRCPLKMLLLDPF